LVEVVLADVRSVVRKGLALVISREPDMELLFEASSAEEAVEAVGRLGRPNRTVVLVSLGLGGEPRSREPS
jgi:DNA-binding NarL/FixJ family response regulator